MSAHNRAFIRLLDLATSHNRGLVVVCRQLDTEEIRRLYCDLYQFAEEISLDDQPEKVEETLYRVKLIYVPLGDDGILYQRSADYIGVILDEIPGLIQELENEAEQSPLPVVFGRPNPAGESFEFSWVWVDRETLRPVKIQGKEVVEGYNTLSS